jgi:hypothetical protein
LQEFARDQLETYSMVLALGADCSALVRGAAGLMLLGQNQLLALVARGSSLLLVSEFIEMEGRFLGSFAYESKIVSN